MDATAQSILRFWLDEVGPPGWYAPDAALDATIRGRFAETWQAARQGALDGWMCNPEACLALVVVLDQFPRNMFRADARAFATDAKALAIVKAAIQRGHDKRIDLPARQFFYLPLEHSEALADQARSVRQFVLSFGPGELLDHARAHRWVIRSFGRFPYRNVALGRSSTPAELAFLDAGGYRAALAEVAA